MAKSHDGGIVRRTWAGRCCCLVKNWHPLHLFMRSLASVMAVGQWNPDWYALPTKLPDVAGSHTRWHGSQPGAADLLIARYTSSRCRWRRLFCRGQYQSRHSWNFVMWYARALPCLLGLVGRVGWLRKACTNHPLFLTSARRGEMLGLGHVEVGLDYLGLAAWSKVCVGLGRTHLPGLGLTGNQF
jgi:hypothetical protein